MIRRVLALSLVAGLVFGCSSTGAPSPVPPATAAPATAGSSSPPASDAASSPANADWCAQFSFETVKPGVLMVATYGTGRPDIIVNADKSLGGLEGALFNHFAAACGLTIELFETTFASMILAVKNREADVGTYIFWNPDRSKQVYYTYPHWIADVTHVFTRADFPYTDASSLEGKKVGTVVGFVWAPYLQKSLGDNAALFPDDTTGSTALLQGQIDGWINGSATLHNAVFDAAPGKVSSRPFKAGDFGIPASLLTNKSYRIVSCNNKELSKALSEGMRQMIDSGEYAKVMAENQVPPEEAPDVADPEQGC